MKEKTRASLILISASDYFIDCVMIECVLAEFREKRLKMPNLYLYIYTYMDTYIYLYIYPFLCSSFVKYSTKYIYHMKNFPLGTSKHQ